MIKTAKFSLLLDGKVLQFKALNSSSQRKFRDKGNKKGAKKAWTMLQEAGLGHLTKVKAQRGTDMVNYNSVTCIVHAWFAAKLTDSGN